MSNSQKNFMSIRSKLLAAVAMLLVASFMVVSSTYAWFTLSTAPEVTGITTQIGANGNLEIALNTGGTIINYPGNSFTGDKNTTWGNIIDLAKDSYGLKTIMLKPSMLLLGAQNDAGASTIATNPLATPVYGDDGRVKDFSKNSFYGASDGNGGFTRDDDGGYGVRAIGTVSSMTEQQRQYATSVAYLNTNLNEASSAASKSLRDNGAKLVEMLLKGFTGDANTEFTVDELAPLGGMITSLNTVPGKLEDVVKNYILIALSHAHNDKSNADFAAIVSWFNGAWSTENTGIFAQLKNGVDTVTISVPAADGTTTEVSFTIPPEVKTVMTAYNKINDSLNGTDGAATKYGTVKTTGQSVKFETVKEILRPLMDVSKITINESDYDEISDMDMDALVAWASGFIYDGFSIAMPEGSGVYADIASVTKNINVSFTATDLNVSYKPSENSDPITLPLQKLDINMATTLTPDQITRLDPATKFGGQPTGKDAEAEAVISDTYAYVLDFAFRTNAASSNLLLQQAAKDRIYGTNEDSTSETWGGGSYMEFATQAGFGDASVKNLMDNIRFVFVDTDTSEILAVGGLDTAKATSDGSSVKAYISLYHFTEKEENGNKTINVGEQFGADEKQIISALGQNLIRKVSVYVYLDGTTIENADVPALEDISGNLNLQFASDATLKPMDYADLKPQTTPNA